jgi:hypothetical protein
MPPRLVPTETFYLTTGALPSQGGLIPELPVSVVSPPGLFSLCLLCQGLLSPFSVIAELCPWRIAAPHRHLSSGVSRLVLCLYSSLSGTGPFTLPLLFWISLDLNHLRLDNAALWRIWTAPEENYHSRDYATFGAAPYNAPKDYSKLGLYDLWDFTA